MHWSLHALTVWHTQPHGNERKHPVSRAVLMSVASRGGTGGVDAWLTLPFARRMWILQTACIAGCSSRMWFKVLHRCARVGREG